MPILCPLHFRIVFAVEVERRVMALESCFWVSLTLQKPYEQSEVECYSRREYIWYTAQNAELKTRTQL
jgi:hypothetical protein